MNKYVFTEKVPVKDVWATHLCISVHHDKKSGFCVFCTAAKIEGGLIHHNITSLKHQPLVRCGRQSQKRFDEAVRTYKNCRELILEKFSKELGLKLA